MEIKLKKDWAYSPDGYSEIFYKAGATLTGAAAEAALQAKVADEKKEVKTGESNSKGKR